MIELIVKSVLMLIVILAFVEVILNSFNKR